LAYALAELSVTAVAKGSSRTSARAAASGEPAPRPITLPIEHLQPRIRSADRGLSPLVIPERVIRDFELVVLVRAAGRLVLRDRALEMVPHQLLLLPPWLPHAFAGEASCDLVAVHFDLAPGVPGTTHAERAPYEVRLAPNFEFPLEQRLGPEDGIEDASLALVREWSSESAAGRLAAQAWLTLILSRLMRQRGTTAGGGRHQPVPAGLQRALAEMRSRFAEPLTTGDCARIAGLSPTRFAHRFRELVGYAPMEYLRRLRIERARRLLGEGRMSVGEIAAACGFADPFHFSRVFRSIDGLSPSQYRETVLSDRGAEPGSTAPAATAPPPAPMGSARRSRRR
jgi:AraC-like DNA-binding protein